MTNDIRVTIRTPWGDLRGVLRDVPLDDSDDGVLMTLNNAAKGLGNGMAIISPAGDYLAPWEQDPPIS